MIVIECLHLPKFDILFIGISVSYHDIEAIDPNYYKSLKQILELPIEVLGIDMNFTAESNELGVLKVNDLIPNGSNVVVTDDNKYEYVRLIAHYRMTNGIRKQVLYQLLIMSPQPYCVIIIIIICVFNI